MPPKAHPLRECAEIRATMTEQIKNLINDLGHVEEAVFGNGKEGLDQQAKENRRLIQDNAGKINKFLDEQEKRKEETRADTRKLLIAVVVAVVTNILAIGQNLLTK